MYRVCIQKSTGKLLEMQSGGTTQEHLDTLTKNQINQGYEPDDIESKFISNEEWEVMRAEFNKKG